MSPKKFSIKSYLESIMEIIEDKPNFLIPWVFYAFLIVFHFLQTASYILSTYEPEPINES